jgi:hypothetical protein
MRSTAVPAGVFAARVLLCVGKLYGWLGFFFQSTLWIWVLIPSAEQF